MENIKKRWTALKAVKIISFALIILACFGFLNRGITFILEAENAGVDPGIVFADLDSEQYFHRHHMWRAQNDAWPILMYGSEENILAGQHLRWERATIHGAWSYFLQDVRSWHEFFLVDTVFESQQGNSLIDRGSAIILAQGESSLEDYDVIFRDPDFFVDLSPDGHVSTVEIRREILRQNIFSPLDDSLPLYDIDFGLRVDSPEARRELKEIVISIQLESFRSALERLDSTEGLLFYVNSHSNVSTANQTPEFFENHSVSHVEDNLYLAFDDNFVAATMARYAELQTSFMFHAINMAIFVVIALFLLVVLLCGAGRKYRTEGVHFAPVDRPYLDISLFIVGLVAVLSLLLVDELLGAANWGGGNVTALNGIFAAASIVIISPILLWLMSFFKRLKAGKPWKHTLVYAVLAKVLYRFLRFVVLFCINKGRALWAGAKLTGKVAIISAISFIFFMFISLFSISMDGRGFIVIFPIILGATATIVILLLRYSKRIHTLELGALRANEGNYDVPIEVGGGELGSIAASINNISEGIGKTVDERMKSERLKTELITNVSHDIRTPLTSIITYTDLLKHEGLDSEKAPEYLDVLTQKSQRLKTLTDELFEAAKAATGNIDVNLSDLDIIALLNQVLGESDATIKDSGLDIRTKFPQSKLSVRADGRLMQRVVENLLSNVCKYSLPNSRVYIDVSQTDDSRMKLDIKNISATELNFDPSELTERFKRGDDSRSDGGSGLGLSIVQSFVIAQGGRFEIAIDGDLFKATVTLPL